MQYRVLGGLEVTDGDAVLELGSPKQRQVLAVLLLERGRVVPVDRLVELLWGEEQPKALSSLQAYISRLRSILEPDRAPRDPATVLVTQPPGYRLSVERDSVDLFRFEDLVASGRARLLAGDLSEAIAILDEALASWTGPILPELADEPFVIAVANRLTQVQLAALEAAAEARLAVGDHVGALSLLEPEAAAHPLRESLHALLALALYRAGRQADALRAVDRCRKALSDIAGLDPGPDLRRLEADLFSQAASLDWARPPHHAPQAEVPTVSRTVPRSGLVGRDAELDALTHRLTAAEQGHGGVAVVIGEPGIGKTRLVEELVATADHRGIKTAWARCPESGAAPPFWPATQLGEQLRAAGVIEAQLVTPDGADTAEVAQQARFGLYRRVLDVVAAIDEPLLLVVDDLQWADPDSLRLVENIAGDLPSTRVLLVVTTRPLTESSPTALVDCLAEIARVPAAVQLRLNGLGLDDVSQWLGQRTDIAVSSEVAALVHDRTGGNPLFVKELTDLLAAEGRLGDPSAVRSARAIPPGVQFVVRRRVSRLPVTSQLMLGIAAVVGRTFDVHVVAAAAGSDASSVLDALAPALDAGLLVDSGGELAFSHALVADALADEINAARKARVHAAAARALADAAGPRLGNAAATIAHHALEGILAGTGQLAVEASTTAARLAAARYADEDAATHWADAAFALERSCPGDIASRAEALIEQGRALLRVDLVEAAKAPLLAAIDLADAAGMSDLMGQAASLFGHAHVWTNEGYGVVDQRVVAALERTLAILPDVAVTARAAVLGALASELVFADPDRHRKVCAEAEATARATGDPLTLARVLIDIMLPNRAEDTEVRHARAVEIRTLAETHGLPPEIAFAGHHQVALSLLEVADLDGAMEAITRARGALETMPGSKFRSQQNWFEAGIEIVRGHYDKASSLVHEAHEIHRKARGYDADVLLVTGVAAIAMDRGGLEQIADPATDVATDSAYERSTTESMAFGMLELGRHDLAAQMVAPFGPSSPFPDDWTTLFTAVAALHVRSEFADAEGAAAISELLAPFSGRWACCGSASISMGLVDLALARGAATLGDNDRARALFAVAAAEHERMGAAAWLARTLFHQGVFLRSTGAGDAGDAALARAAALSASHGFPYVERRLDLLSR